MVQVTREGLESFHLAGDPISNAVGQRMLGEVLRKSPAVLHGILSGPPEVVLCTLLFSLVLLAVKVTTIHDQLGLMQNGAGQMEAFPNVDYGS